MGLGVKTDARWTNGIVPYRFIIPADPSSKQEEELYKNALMLMGVIKRCMSEWMYFVNSDGIHISFVEQGAPLKGNANVPNDAVKYIRLTTNTNTTAGANGKATGNAGGNIARFPIETANKDNWKSIPHELGHILGLSHENERNGLLDDTPYQPGAIPRLCLNFKRSETEPKANASEMQKKYFTAPGPWAAHLSVLNNNVDDGGPYDPESIMHYPAFDKFVWNCRKDSATDPNGSIAVAAILRELRIKLNYPSLGEVAPEALEQLPKVFTPWAPSEGDIAMIQFMYPKREAQNS